MTTGNFKDHNRSTFIIRLSSGDQDPFIFTNSILPIIKLEGGGQNYNVALLRCSYDDSYEKPDRSLIINSNIVKATPNGDAKIAQTLFRIPYDYRTKGGHTVEARTPVLEWNPVSTSELSQVSIEILDSTGSRISPGTSSDGGSKITTIELIVSNILF